MKNALSLLILLISTTALFAQSDGDKNPILTDRFIIEAGWYFPSENVDLGVSGSIDAETIEDIDFDETLGLSGGKNTFNLQFRWRFSKSKFWAVSGEYFGLSTEESLILEEEIEWEDATYPVGAEAKLGYSLSLYRVFFSRVISTGQKHELTGGLGIHGLNTKGFIEGEANVGGESAGIERREESIFLPLPNIGAAYIWAPSARWALMARVDWFGIKIDNISGGLWNVSPSVTYSFTKHFGISGSYQFLNFNADIDEEDWRGNFDLAFGGPSIRLVGHF
jgi:hypothetical protein